MDFDQKSFISYFNEGRNWINSVRDLVTVWIKSLSLVPPWKGRKIKHWIFKCADFGVTMLGASMMNLLGPTVFLVRNPFGLINSIKKRREYEKGREFNIFELMEICHHLENSVELLQKIDTRHLVIKYEELILDSKREILKICKFWNVEWHQAVLSPTLLDKPWTINTSFRGSDKKIELLSNSERKFIAENTQKYRKAYQYPANY